MRLIQIIVRRSEEISTALSAERLTSSVLLNGFGFSMQNIKKHGIIKNQNRKLGDGMGSIKPWEDSTIQDDYMFKLFMRRKHICKTMIEKILRIKLADIHYIDEEKTVKPKYESKGVRLDV